MLEIAPLLLYMRIRLSTVVTRYSLLSVALSVNRCHVSETPQLACEPTDRLLQKEDKGHDGRQTCAPSVSFERPFVLLRTGV